MMAITEYSRMNDTFDPNTTLFFLRAEAFLSIPRTRHTLPRRLALQPGRALSGTVAG